MAKQEQNPNRATTHNGASEQNSVKTLHQLMDSVEEPLAEELAAEVESTAEGKNSDKEEKKSKSDSKLSEAKRERRRRIVATIESIFTGDILLAKEANRVYNYLMLLGVIFLVSIFTMFRAFQKERERSELQDEVVLLKERVTRTSEERTKQSSHSSILNKLKERGIELGDPTTAPTVIR